MTEGSKKKRVFFLVEGKNYTYIKNIEKDYRIVRTKNPTWKVLIVAELM